MPKVLDCCVSDLTSSPSQTSPPAPLRPHPQPLSRGEGIVEVRELVGKSNFFLFSSLFKLHFYPEYPRIRISTFF